MQELLERTADPAMGLTVTLFYDSADNGRTLLVVESETTGYHERREVSGEDALVAFNHPFATFEDMPSPWSRATSDHDEHEHEHDEDEDGGNVVERIGDYTSPNGGTA